MVISDAIQKEVDLFILFKTYLKNKNYIEIFRGKVYWCNVTCFKAHNCLLKFQENILLATNLGID